MPIDITLTKEKYRFDGGRWIWREHCEGRMGIPKPGTRVFSAGRFGAKPRTNPAKGAINTIKPRRKAYGPW